MDEGKLSWDDRVVDRLPGFQMYDPYVTHEMTIRDLLTHRSGLGLGAGDLLFFPPSIRHICCDSNTSVADFQPGGDVAAPHSEVEGKLQPIPAAQIDNTAPAGAINSSASDMAKWMIVQLGGGQIPGGQKRLFSQSPLIQPKK